MQYLILCFVPELPLWEVEAGRRDFRNRLSLKLCKQSATIQKMPMT